MMQKRKRGMRLGWHGYAEVMKALRATPMTNGEIAERFSMTPCAAALMTRQMACVGLVHVSAWEKPSNQNGPWRAVFSLGQGVEPPYPGKSRHKAYERKNNLRSSLISLASVVRCLEHPVSIKDLVEFTGCSPSGMTTLIRTMHKLGLVYVADWSVRVGQGGYPERLFQFGERADARLPDPMSEKLRNKRRYWTRVERAKHQEFINASAGNSDAWRAAA